MVRIITDSSTLFTEEDARQMNIDVLPLCVSIGDMDGRDLYIDMAEFYERIANGGIPHSSQPPIGEVIDAYEKYPEDEIINIAMADGLSGTYQSACGARESVDNRDYITVYNTRTLCGPHRYMVKKACEMRDAGKRAGEIVEWLTHASDNQESFLIPQDFGFLRRGGRLTPMAATFASTLKLKPIMTQTPDGCRLDKYAIKRNLKQAVGTIIERMKQKGVDAGYKIYVSHADTLADAKMVLEQIKEHFADVEMELLDLGAAFVTQGGPKCVAIQYIEK